MSRPVRVNFMKCKEILTKHVSPMLDFSILIQYFTSLWSKLSEEMDVYLKREDVIVRIGEKNIGCSKIYDKFNEKKTANIEKKCPHIILR